MKTIHFVIMTLMLGLAGVADAEEPRLQFQKEISAASKPEESLVSVALDADVFAATQPSLADMRLRDAQGATLPYVVRKVQEQKSTTVRRKTWTPVKRSLKPLDDGGLEIVLNLDKDDPQPNGLTIVTSLKNFEQRVRIESSLDGTDWATAGAETVIFDYARYMDIRSDSVSFPATDRKHFRIVIDDVTSEQESELLELTRRLQGKEETERTERVTIDRRPFRIERIEFWQDLSQEQVTGDHKQLYPVTGFKVTEDSKNHQTVILIDTHREPLTSLELQTSSRNFSRSCVVEIQEQHGVQSTWTQIGTTTLSQLDFKTLKREQLTVTFPESRQSQYRLVIDNRDSPPLTVTGIKAEGNVYEVVFLSASNKPHRLEYSDPAASAPSYDTASIQSLLTERFRPESVKLGAEQKIAGVAPAGWKPSDLLNDARLLTGVIGLLVLVLGWGLYTAVKRMDNLPPPAGSE